jgi:hypothetical protein
MIHLDLGAEPAALARARANGIKKYANTRAQLGFAGRQEITGYNRSTRKPLHDRQRGKCAWCERPVGASGNPVDHVRPKLGAENRDGTTDPDHYWWLAWTWDNLVFTCESCNCQANKGNKFWLVPGTARMPTPPNSEPLPLQSTWFDTSVEQPLLVHPRHEDPLEYVEWKVVDRGAPRSRWRWTLVGRDAQRGEATIELLKLDECVDQVNKHLHDTVLKADRVIRRGLQAGRLDEAREDWGHLLADHLDDPAALFRGAVWWAILSLWPPSERAKHGFSVPQRPAVRWSP